MHIRIIGLLGLIALPVLPLAAQVPVKGKPAVQASESIQFMQTIVGKMGSKDARLRFAVREALVVMGKQAIPVLNEAKAGVKCVHLKAFMTRTIARLKSIKTFRGRSYPSTRGRDIDRLAMVVNLTLEQVTNVSPILAKYDKNVKELWAEFKEAGGYTDKEAYKDIQDELKLLVDESRPTLRRYLTEKQVNAVCNQLRPGGSAGGLRMIGGGGGGGIRVISPGRKK